MTARSRSSKAAIGRHHAEWLRLVEVSGPFLELSALAKVFPQGLDPDDSDHVASLRVAHDEWLEDHADEAIHRTWIDWILCETLEQPDEVLRREGALDGNWTVAIKEHQETLRPDVVLVDGDTPRLFVTVLPPGQGLEKTLQGARWKASPATRMTELLRGCAGSGVRLGLVTNGEHWMLVHAAPGEATTYASWWATVWREERVTLQAFRSLLRASRFFAPEDETLEAMIAASAKDQQEVADQLGLQVRTSIEMLIRTIDRIDRDRHGELLGDMPPKRLYEASVTVMMRLVFLLYAEERDLIGVDRDDPFYAENYAISTLVDRLRDAADQHGEEILERRHEAWGRLLATFRAVYSGVDHEIMRLPAYGGSLFDPERFPFLEGRSAGSSEHASLLPIDDRTVLHVLEALQFLRIKGAASGAFEQRRLSFRALGVEQIGHVYESLLDHTAVRADGAVLGLAGTKYKEPEVPVEELDRLTERGQKALVEFLTDETGRTAPALKRALEYEPSEDEHDLMVVCEGDAELASRVEPYLGLVRDDPNGFPYVIQAGSAYATAGADRRSSGTHYTPPEFTEPIVKHTLDPLVYVGPAEGQPEEEWVLKPAAEILKLKVCDMACGSGAFLVQTARYLSERLVEAWEQLEQENPGKVLVSPEGELSEGRATESLIPADPDERLALAVRYVVDRCVYGVDKDPMAVEMAKLSLWLITLQKGRPFTFLDHALKCGDSLLGITDAEQIYRLSLDPTEGQPSLFAGAAKEALERAIEARAELESFSVHTIDDASRKRRLLEAADAALADVRLVADGLVAVGLAEAGLRRGRQDAAARSLLAEITNEVPAGQGDPEVRRRVASLRCRLDDLLDTGNPDPYHPRCAFHWLVEFPEVFLHANGFDAVIGNPPFLGSMRIAISLGDQYLSYVKEACGAPRGNADLAAYFLLRAADIAGAAASVGLILTKSIAEGKTREISTCRLLEKGWKLLRADHDLAWPGAASVMVSRLWFCNRRWSGRLILNGAVVPRISSHLDQRPEHEPCSLRANASLISRGTVLLGAGFALDRAEAEQWIEDDPRYRARLLPFLTGQDFNTEPGHRPLKAVLWFDDVSLAELEAYPRAYQRIVDLVKPKRDRLTRQIHEHCFWKHWDKRETAYKTLRGTSHEAIVLPVVTKYISAGVVPSSWIFSDKLSFLTIFTHAMFGLLQSAVHVSWARRYCSSLGARYSYSISKCFKTLPILAKFVTPTSDVADIEEAAVKYLEARSNLSQSRGFGLTKIYNAFHDPAENSQDFKVLRDRQVELDGAVLHAYGWEDPGVEHGFFDHGRGSRFGLAPPVDQVLFDRLFDLNLRRGAAKRVAT